MAASSQCTAALCIKVPQTWQGTKQLPITSPSLSSLETSGQARLSSTPALPSASLRWYLPVCFTDSNNIHSTQPFYLTHQIALPFKRSPSPNSTLQVKSCGSHLSPYLYQRQHSGGAKQLPAMRCGRRQGSSLQRVWSPWQHLQKLLLGGV